MCKTINNHFKRCYYFNFYSWAAIRLKFLISHSHEWHKNIKNLMPFSMSLKLMIDWYCALMYVFLIYLIKYVYFLKIWSLWGRVFTLDARAFQASNIQLKKFPLKYSFWNIINNFVGNKISKIFLIRPQGIRNILSKKFFITYFYSFSILRQRFWCLRFASNSQALNILLHTI